MADVLHHFVRRGVNAVNDQYVQVQSTGNDGEPDIKQLALWGIILLYATCAIYFLTLSALNYTYGELVSTLAMVETPTAAAVTVVAEGEENTTAVDAPLLSEEQLSEKQKLRAMESELFLVKQPPITGKFRRATKHLRSVGGRLARFRGLHIFLLYNFMHSFIVGFVAPISVGSPLRPLVSIFATVVLCRLQMVWTHVVISNPTSKPWYRRILSFKAAKHIILPTAIYATAEQAAIYVSMGLLVFSQDQFVRPEAYGDDKEKVRKIALVQLFAVVLIAFSTLLCVVIPAEVTLKRVQASMLPEEDETIVPFDRSFAGKFKPEIVGGTGAIGMLDAWRTFGKEGRIRLIKLYMKLFAVEVATSIFFAFVLVGELRLIMGDDFNKVIKAAHDQLKH